MSEPLKHAELIKEWADGAQIQRYINSGNWCDDGNPSWDCNTIYRVKPKPTQVTYFACYPEGLSGPCEQPTDLPVAIERLSGILRIEIDYNKPDNPKLVSALLERLC